MRVVRLLILLTVALTAAPALAQFGHPLKGTWIGEWGPNKEHVVVELKWDGNAIAGTINPGASGIPLKVATFDAPKWTVHLEADGKEVRRIDHAFRVMLERLRAKYPTGGSKGWPRS